MMHIFRVVYSTLIVTVLTDVAAEPTDLPSTANVLLNVHKLTSVDGTPQPFDGVGLFEILSGDTPINKACLSRSSSKGKVSCKIACDPNDTTDITLLVRAPGSDRVPGYESPVSVELAQRGCTFDQQKIGFTYKTLELALGEVLTSDPQLAQAVTEAGGMVASEDVFRQLRAFEASEPALKQLAVARSPNFERFSRIMRDAEVSAAKAPHDPKNQAWRKSSAEYSTGTRSVLLQAAASRSLGEGVGEKLVPVSKDPLTLYSAKLRVAVEIEKKPDKSSFDRLLGGELRRTTPVPIEKFKGSTDIKTIDWVRISRAQGSK